MNMASTTDTDYSDTALDKAIINESKPKRMSYHQTDISLLNEKNSYV